MTLNQKTIEELHDLLVKRNFPQLSWRKLLWKILRVEKVQLIALLRLVKKKHWRKQQQ